MNTHFSSGLKTLTLLLFVVWSQAILAGDVYRGTGVGDVVVATIKAVAKEPATNGNPPGIVLQVHEVLRGDAKADRTQAIWEPEFHGIDYGEPTKNPDYLRWREKPLVPPKAGTKWILWGDIRPVDAEKPDGAKKFYVNPYHHYDFDDKRRTWAVEVIKADEAQRRAQEQLRAADEAREKELRKKMK